MANESRSRSTVPSLRWGETTAEVPDATNVAEPSGGKRDIGWIPGGEGLVGEWLNALFWAAGVTFRYIENFLAIGWFQNSVMPGAAAGEGVVTAGAGLTVNVTATRVWIAGQMQAVPAATNLALAVADATNPRIDLVIAEVVALAPVYSIVTGTPGASPAAPAVPSTAAVIYEVRVNALAVVPTSFADRRERGYILSDRIAAPLRFRAGEVSANKWLLSVEADTPGTGVLSLGDSDDPPITVFELLDVVHFRPDKIVLQDPVVRIYDLKGGDFAPAVGADVDLSALSTWVSATSGITNQTISATARFQKGVQLTELRIVGTKTHADCLLDVELIAYDRTTNVATVIASVDNTGTALGDFTLVDTFTHTVDLESVYVLYVLFTAISAQSVTLFHAEIEYEEDQPWVTL